MVRPGSDIGEDSYLLELVRYIHLNPVRSTLPVTIESLDDYAWTGHSVLLGKQKFTAQDCEFVLAHFGRTVREAVEAYRVFMIEGSRRRTTPDLEGGGLRRSAGGWELMPTLTSGRERWAFDQRILGSDVFVQQVLARIDEPVLQQPGDPDHLLHTLCDRAAARFAVSAAEMRTASRRRPVLHARAVVSRIAVSHYGLSLTALGRHLNVSKQSIARDLRRVEAVLAEHDYSATDFIVG
ncbi:MAG: hypothetical protein U0587_11510 [Candidatus Binatia bacterium]